VKRARLPLSVAAVVALIALAALFATSPSVPPVAKPPTAHAATHPATTVVAPRRPNIVFVLTDDLSMNLLPYLPQVRAMQRDGVTLSHYYVVDSLCCPSRAAIFTGAYPHDNGVFANVGRDGGYGAYLRHGDEQKSFAVTLQGAGYRTGFMGKYLNGYQASDPAAPGWDTWVATGNGYGEFDYDLNVDGVRSHHGHAPSDYLTDVLSQRAQHFVETARRDPRPFMLEVATFAPHAPSTPAPRYANAHPGLRYPRTAAYGRVPTGATAWLAKHPALTARQSADIDVAYRKRVQSMMAVDDLVGRLRATLAANHLADNTYLVFSSDNGFHMGEDRLLPGKQTAFDTDIHVPLVVVGPGVPAGRSMPQLASNIDLAPTFESLAGAPNPATVDGVSLVDLWHGHAPVQWQTGVLVEHRRPHSSKADPDLQLAIAGLPPTYDALRTASALYVRYADGTQELYDTGLDPLEQHNIAAAGVPVELERALLALRSCHGQLQCQAAGRLP
jgi:N-acetylglucosamine-6-sulfatase